MAKVRIVNTKTADTVMRLESEDSEMIMDALFVVVGMKHEVLQSYDEFCNKVSKCLWEIRGNTEMKYFFCGNNDQWMMVFQSE